MTWVAVGVAGTTAVIGAVNASNQRKAQQKATEQANQSNANIAAAQQEFSPWTGMKPSSPTMQAAQPGQSTLGGAAQGALGGAMFAQGLKKPEAAAPTAPGGGGVPGAMAGGNDPMSQEEMMKKKYGAGGSGFSIA